MRRQPRLLYVLFAVYLLGAGAICMLNQPGNAPDEPSHLAYARYWQASGQMPIFERSPYWPRYTAVHPPLYYGVLKTILPYVSHQPMVVQYRLLRIPGIIFHLGVLVCLWIIARTLRPDDDRFAVGCVGIAALNPMFGFQAAAISNEALAVFALSLALACGVVLDAPRGTRTLLPVLLLGLAIGAACLSKMSTVVPGFALFACLLLRRKLTGIEAALVGVIILLMAGPIFLRNWRLYGDIFAANAIYKVEPHAGGWANFPHFVVASFRSFWAVFGWMSTSVPEPYYWILAGLCLLGIIGFYRSGFWRERVFTPVLLLAGLSVAQACGFGLTTMQWQGKYLLVGIAAFAPILFAGLQYWVEKATRPWRTRAWVALLLFGLCLYGSALRAIAGSALVIPGVYNYKLAGIGKP